jgi:hypothetical protein
MANLLGNGDVGVVAGVAALILGIMLSILVILMIFRPWTFNSANDKVSFWPDKPA